MTFVTGTIRKNRRGIPDELLGKYKVGDKRYMRSKEILGLAYREKSSQKSQVILVSSDSKAANVQVSKNKGTKVVIKTKPDMIHQYNKFMGGIDTTDQMLYSYLDERRTVKYWRKITFNILSRMILNSYILYKMNCKDKPKSRLNFTINVIETLAQDWLIAKNIPANLGGGDGQMPLSRFGMDKIPEKKEKNCCVCSTKKSKKENKTALFKMYQRSTCRVFP
ncbi:hypothetical protein J6590_108442 [Homalodisca vitripennis]|nr:hypothetical protein J6590_108442 [Homalodisca vitripennis]